MAALPAKFISKGEFTLWQELTNRLVSLGAMATSDTVSQALAKAALEEAAH